MMMLTDLAVSFLLSGSTFSWLSTVPTSTLSVVMITCWEEVRIKRWEVSVPPSRRALVTLLGCGAELFTAGVPVPRPSLAVLGGGAHRPAGGRRKKIKGDWRVEERTTLNKHMNCC